MFYANKQNSVKVRCLTAEDENILTNPDLIRSGRVLNVLLDSAVIDKTLRPEKMISGDRNAVMLKLRSIGYGDDYEVKISCEKCSADFKSTVKLSELKNKPTAFPPDQLGEFSLTLPNSKIDIKFRMLTGEDEDRLMKVANTAKKKIGNNSFITGLLTERYLLQIMEVKGNRDKTYIKKFISAMPISDSLFLREYIKNTEPGVDMEHTFECPECQAFTTTDVPITAKLFWPNSDID